MSDSQAPSINKIFINTLIKGLEESKKGIDSLQKQVHANDLSMVGLNSKVDKVSSDIEHLLKIVRDGNGQESIVQRLTKVEIALKDIEETMKESRENNKDERRSRVSVKIALITSVLALVGVLSSPFLAAIAKSLIQ